MTSALAVGLRRDVARLEADARLASSRGDERAALSRLLEAEAVRAEIALAEDLDDLGYVPLPFFELGRIWLLEQRA